MEWQEEAFDGEDVGFAAIDKAFTLIHPGPSAAQQKKQGAGAAASATEITRALMLEAYPQLNGEPEGARLARASASTACWDALAANFQVSLGQPQVAC